MAGLLQNEMKAQRLIAEPLAILNAGPSPNGWPLAKLNAGPSPYGWPLAK